MQINNSLTPQKPMTFADIVNSHACQLDIKNSIQDNKERNKFTADLISLVAENPKIRPCYPETIVSAALTGYSLKLSSNPSLGQYYVVPYGQKAQFQLGYKGLVQLAIRSGNYKKLNVLPVKQGELIKFDPFNEEIEVNPIEDPEARESAPTIGYYATFTYLNGFKKSLYWSKAKMEAHARKYSKSYNSFWGKDFDSMACKTMLRQLITKWGVMSSDMQTAIEKDSECYSIQYQDSTYSDAYRIEPSSDETVVNTENVESEPQFIEIMESDENA